MLLLRELPSTLAHAAAQLFRSFKGRCQQARRLAMSRRHEDQASYTCKIADTQCRTACDALLPHRPCMNKFPELSGARLTLGVSVSHVHCRLHEEEMGYTAHLSKPFAPVNNVFCDGADAGVVKHQGGWQLTDATECSGELVSEGHCGQTV